MNVLETSSKHNPTDQNRANPVYIFLIPTTFRFLYEANQYVDLLVQQPHRPIPIPIATLHELPDVVDQNLQ